MIELERNMEIVVTTASKLSQAQADKIVDAYAKKFSIKSSQITLVNKIDPSVIAGVRIAKSSSQIDHTIARKLSELKKELLKMKA